MSAAIDWIFSFLMFLFGLGCCLFLIAFLVGCLVVGVAKIKEVRKHDRDE